jgi:hypothetical protein
MADLLHIYIKPNPGVTTAQIEQKLNLALDWFKYRDQGYLVYTSKSLIVWNNRFREIAQPDGYVLILPVDLYDYKGFMPKSIWPWLTEKKKDIYGEEQ